MLGFIRKLFSRGKNGEHAPEKKADAAASSADTQDEDAGEPLPESPHASKAWLAIGLDGALASMGPDGLRGPIGPPVYNTVQRLKDWTEFRDLRVKILTPRAATEEGAAAVRQWLKEHKLPELEVTHKKDLNMVECWAANCVQVISNTGQIVATSPSGLDQAAKKAEELPVKADAHAADASTPNLT